MRNRILDKDNIASKYNLELVAGNFFLAVYSGRASDELSCYFTKCTREPFPASIPGVTDLPSCQPNTEVFDLTIRGPKLGKLKDFGAAIKNLGDTIRGSKKDGISTGLLTETQTYFGIFGDTRAGDVLPAGNLNTTLDGQVNNALLTYQSRDGASRLFKETLTDFSFVSTFSGDAPLSITWSEPDDQEFTLATILQTPGEVAFVNLGVVSDRPKYLELREKLFAKFANSPYIKDFYKFNIWRGQPDALPFLDNSKVELFMYTARSRADQARFVQELIENDSEFVNEWWNTFVCRACMAIDRQLSSDIQFALNNRRRNYYSP